MIDEKGLKSFEEILDVARTHVTRYPIALTKVMTAYIAFSGAWSKQQAPIGNLEMVKAIAEVSSSTEEFIEAATSILEDLMKLILFLSDMPDAIS